MKRKTDQLARKSMLVASRQQQGYVIVTILVIVMIAGLLLSSTMRTTLFSGQTAYHAIQYSRAMTAAEGGVAFAQQEIIQNMGNRRFADSVATDGVFSRDAIGDKWWSDTGFTAQQAVDDGILQGVAKSPEYVYEQVGEYVADGGTGVVNLDVGGASYGKTSASGREHLLYKVQSYGVGSQSDVPRAIETTVVVTK